MTFQTYNTGMNARKEEYYGGVITAALHGVGIGLVFARFEDDSGLELFCTCSFKIRTKFKSFTNATFGMSGEGFFDVVHSNPPRVVFTFPEQSVNEYLKKVEMNIFHYHVFEGALRYGYASLGTPKEFNSSLFRYLSHFCLAGINNVFHTFQVAHT